MRVRIVRTFQAGSQTLNAGLLCEPIDSLARDWIAQGLAEAVDAHAKPAQGDGVNTPSAKPVRRPKG